MLSFMFKISRFRFWIYTGGTFVVGYALAVNTIGDFFRLDYYIYLLYFFFFANVFIYGVNDYWDEETDKNNPKKDEKEYRIVNSEKRNLLRVIYLVAGISLVLLFFQTNLERILFLIFLLLSYFYSSPPLRFKERPLLDFSSNYLYIMPGIFAYSMVSNSLPSLIILTGAYFHISAMHIFSAIPDVEYDRAAGINTTPVFIGEKYALILTLIFWSILSVIVIILAGFRLLSFLVLLYPLFPLLLLITDKLDINKLYWYLPYVNTALGGLLFFALIVNKNILSL
ncbi:MULTISPECIES: prenyltransferase [Methanobacterium]|uniref:Prenyltransferase n=1 Tax=Methanobacterium veterum TaxID=408577 RepID=A0A9E5A7K5_9EURY|nr:MULTISPECIES: prenyltransferase [Methanobacterium]MCZ3366847.1 prenyltransferase [Methanobacterium veterum]MCZ3374006.1 prenyltransferase [Methanobacterium veterum]